MGTLYDIVGEIRELYEMMTDPDVDPQLIADTLEGVTGDLEVKAEGYINVIKQLEMEADACANQIAFWTTKKNVRENAIKRMKTALCTAMIETGHDGKDGLKAGDWVLKVQNNGGKQPMKVDKENVPDSYMKVIFEADNDKIRKALESGEKLDFAYLEERGKHIAIK